MILIELKQFIKTPKKQQMNYEDNMKKDWLNKKRNLKQKLEISIRKIKNIKIN